MSDDEQQQQQPAGDGVTDKLVQMARLGEARMLNDDQPLAPELAKQVIETVRAFMDRRKITAKAVAKGLNISEGTLSAVLSGTYNGDAEKHLRNLDKWHEGKLLKEAAPRPGGYVDTTVARKIFTLAKYAKKHNAITLGYGPAGIGKTITLQAVHAEFPASIYVSMEIGCETPLSVIEAIGRAARVPASKNTFRAWSTRLKEALAGSDRMILIDEVHKLIGHGNERGLYVLKDLYDATNCPMVWLATNELVTSIQNGVAQGRGPMDQLNSRISLFCDLAADTPVRGGGKPLVTVDDIRRVFNSDTLRITHDAIDFLHKLANLPHSGALRACRKLLETAQHIAPGRPITAELLAQADELRSGREAAAQRRMEMGVTVKLQNLAKIG